jgi:hypothetical protein
MPVRRRIFLTASKQPKNIFDEVIVWLYEPAFYINDHFIPTDHRYPSVAFGQRFDPQAIRIMPTAVALIFFLFAVVYLR